LALALAVTYPNHCPASCWTNNHFVYKENYISSPCTIVRLLTFCLFFVFMSFLCIGAWVKCGLLQSLWHDIKISFIHYINFLQWYEGHSEGKLEWIPWGGEREYCTLLSTSRHSNVV